MQKTKLLTEEEFINEALAKIPSNPIDRSSKKVNAIRQRQNYIYDVHMHAFDKKSINEAYFIMQFVRESVRSKIVGNKILNGNLNNLAISEQEIVVQRFLQDQDANSIDDFFNGKEIPDWDEIESLIPSDVDFEAKKGLKGIHSIQDNREFLGFVWKNFFKSDKQSDLIDFYFDEYALNKQVNLFKDREMIVCMLMMDFMDEFGSKMTKKSYYDQIQEINALLAKDNLLGVEVDGPEENSRGVLPFLAVDPRRVNSKFTPKDHLYHLFLDAFDPERGGQFFGVKIYPALGFSPSDYRLEAIYKVCSKLNIPIVTHCGGEAVSTFKKKIEIFQNFKQSDKTVVEENKDVDKKKRERMIFNLNDPKNFIPVLNKFPDLKINLGHFGGNEAWITNSKFKAYHNRIDTITSLMNYPGVYADFSFCVSDSDTYDEFKKFLGDSSSSSVLKSVMYGTDYWVVLFNDHQRFAQCLNKFTDEVFVNTDLLEHMVTLNPDAYLFGKVK